MATLNDRIAPIAPIEGADLGTFFCWGTSGSSDPGELQEALNAAEIKDFPVPKIMSPANQFKQVMSAFTRVHYKGSAGVNERSLLQHSLTKGRTPEVVVYTSNLAIKSGRRKNDLHQVGSIEFDVATGVIASRTSPNEMVLPEDYARFDLMVATITKAYRAIEGRLTHEEINLALTNYLKGQTGAVKLISTSQNWFIPSIPMLGVDNPNTKINRLLKVLKSTIKGMRIYYFNLKTSAVHLEQMSEAATDKIEKRLSAIAKDLDKEGKMQKRRRTRLQTECTNVGHEIMIYEALLSPAYVQKMRMEVMATRSLISIK